MAKSDTTLEDIANVVGVSTSSVWKAINNRPDVSSVTRKRILALAEKMKYAPRQSQYVLTTGTATALKRVGIVCFEQDRHMLANQAYQRLLQSIEQHLGRIHADMVVEFAGSSLPRCYVTRRVDGLIVTRRPTSQQLQDLTDMPFVVCPNVPDGYYNCNCVAQDNYGGGIMVTCYMANKGHRRILFASHESHVTAFKGRLAGYCQVMRSEGLREVVITDTRPIAECGETLAKKIASEIELSGITAIFASSDHCAECLIEDLAALGFNVPEDISITGWDNSPTETWRGPKITSVDGNWQQAGKEAVRLLARLCGENGDKDEPIRILTTPKLIEGETVAPPKNHDGKKTYGAN
ncbi:MAG: LacI family DNA-binding transcriptional regulator [Planctomycetota bacterium]